MAKKRAARRPGRRGSSLHRIPAYACRAVDAGGNLRRRPTVAWRQPNTVEQVPIEDHSIGTTGSASVSAPRVDRRRWTRRAEQHVEERRPAGIARRPTEADRQTRSRTAVARLRMIDGDVGDTAIFALQRGQQ